MGHSNGIIYAPVNTDDVSATIGAASHDVGTLCTHGNIKTWPKFKPVKVDTPATITDAQRKAVNYGITNIPYFTLGANMASFMRGAGAIPTNGAKTEYFMYDCPGDDDWKRLDDFVKDTTQGYWHGAEAPIFPPASDTISIPASDSQNVDIFFNIGVDDEMCVRLSDLDFTQTVGTFNSANWYVGVCLTNSSRTVAITQTTAMTQIMQYGAVWRVPKATFKSLAPAGNYTAFVFLTNYKMTSFGTFPSSQSGTYYFIPLTFAKKDMTVKEESVNLNMTIAGWRSSANTRYIDYSLSVTNKSSGTITVTKIAIKVYKGETLLAEITPTVSPGFGLDSNKSHSKTGSVDVSTASNRLHATLIRMEVTVNGQVFAAESTVTSTPPQN